MWVVFLKEGTWLSPKWHTTFSNLQWTTFRHQVMHTICRKEICQFLLKKKANIFHFNLKNFSLFLTTGRLVLTRQMGKVTNCFFYGAILFKMLNRVHLFCEDRGYHKPPRGTNRQPEHNVVSVFASASCS